MGKMGGKDFLVVKCTHLPFRVPCDQFMCSYSTYVTAGEVVKSKEGKLLAAAASWITGGHEHLTRTCSASLAHVAAAASHRPSPEAGDARALGVVPLPRSASGNHARGPWLPPGTRSGGASIFTVLTHVSDLGSRHWPPPAPMRAQRHKQS
jgi:hypothetical protein